MGPILMELRHFEFLEGGPKRPKIAENWTLRIYFLFIFAPAPWSFCIGVYFSQYYGTVRVGKKTPVHGRAREGGENKSPNLVQPISPYKSTLLHFGSRV